MSALRLLAISKEIQETDWSGIYRRHTKAAKITMDKCTNIPYIPDPQTQSQKVALLTLSIFPFHSLIHTNKNTLTSSSTLGFTWREIVNGLSGPVEALNSSLSCPAKKVCVLRLFRVYEEDSGVEEKQMFVFLCACVQNTVGERQSFSGCWLVKSITFCHRLVHGEKEKKK